MKLFDLRKSHTNGEVSLTVSVESEKIGTRSLWFSTPARFAGSLCDTRMDGFLVGMLFPAMQHGENIHVAGCVSGKLLFNLNNYVVPLLTAFSPTSKNIQITADQTSVERIGGTGIGTGFSGGVDSFCTIYNRMELELSPEYKINSLLFLNVGSHGAGDSAEKQAEARIKFTKRYEFLKLFPEETGLDFIPLDSNLHTFHPWGHLKTDTLTSAAGILILQSLYKRYYYASAGFSYNQQLDMGFRFRQISVADCCDPMIAPLLATESLDFILDGMQMTRTEKLLQLVEYQPVQKYLNVCVSGQESHTNCSVCSKCCRTLMTLDILHQLEKFSHLFDVTKYRVEAERLFICQQVLLQDRDPFARGNIDLAKQNGFPLPSRVVSYVTVQIQSLRNFGIWAVRVVLPEHVRRKIKNCFMRGH